MKYKVKFRVTSEDGRKQKYSVNLEDGKRFALGMDRHTFELKPPSMQDAECYITIRDGTLYGCERNSQDGIYLNNKRIEEAVIRAGDFLQVGEFLFEFLEAPVPKTSDANGGETRFVDVSEALAPGTQMMRRPTSIQGNPGSTSSPAPVQKKEQAPERSGEHKYSWGDTTSKTYLSSRGDPKVEKRKLRNSRPEETPAPASPKLEEKPKHGSTSKAEEWSFENNERPIEPKMPSSKSAAAARVMDEEPELPRKRPREEDRSDFIERTVTGLVRKAKEATGFTQRPVTYDPGTIDFRRHVAISLAMIAMTWSISGTLAMGGFSLRNLLINFFVGMGGAALIAGLLHYFRNYLTMTADFKEFLRYIAYAAVGSLPWSLGFLGGRILFIFLSVVYSTVVLGLFVLRFRPALLNFAVFVGVVSGGLATGISLTSSKVIKSGGQPEAVAVAPSEDDIPEPLAEAPKAETPEATPPATNPQVAAQTTPAIPSKPAVSNQVSPELVDSLAKEQYFSAVKFGNLDVVKDLVEKKVVDPTFTLELGTSGLTFAAANGHLEVVKYLISKRANINARDPNGTTPLMWAVYRNHKDVVRYLLRAGADVSVRREDGDSAFEIAKKWGRTEILATLETTFGRRGVAGHYVRPKPKPKPTPRRGNTSKYDTDD